MRRGELRITPSITEEVFLYRFIRMRLALAYEPHTKQFNTDTLLLNLTKLVRENKCRYKLIQYLFYDHICSCYSVMNSQEGYSYYHAKCNRVLRQMNTFFNLPENCNKRKITEEIKKRLMHACAEEPECSASSSRVMISLAA